MADNTQNESSQVNLSNWRFPPFNRWGFQHVDDLVESKLILNDPNDIWEFESELIEFDQLSFKDHVGQEMSFDMFLESSYTDAFIVTQKGKIICESYNNNMEASSRHILMSVSKSVLGVITGILIDNKAIDPSKAISYYIPELKNTGYAKCSVQHLLDMTADVDFEEDYYATSGPMIHYRRSTNWDPKDDSLPSIDLKEFLQTINSTKAHHGEIFKYTSPNSDLLGWLVEIVTNMNFSNVASELLWKPLGTELPAYVTIDESGSPRTAGGINTTARDLARLGNLIANGGFRKNKQIISNRWLGELFTGDRNAWESGNFAPYFNGMPISYKNQWYTLNQNNPILFCVGIYGQYMFVDINNDIVIVKFSSQDNPLDIDQKQVMTNACLNIINALN